MEHFIVVVWRKKVKEDRFANKMQPNVKFAMTMVAMLKQKMKWTQAVVYVPISFIVWSLYVLASGHEFDIVIISQVFHTTEKKELILFIL